MSASASVDEFPDLPPAMRDAKRWLTWKGVADRKGGKPRKVPFYADGEPRSGRLDTPEDVARLVSLDDALAQVRQGRCTGLGFALGSDGNGGSWQGVDLDDVAEHPALRLLVEDGLPGYSESSPSGRGVHAIGYGRSFAALGPNASGVEAYAGARFLTVTGESASLADLCDLAPFVEQVLTPLHAQGRSSGARTSAEPPPVEPHPALMDELRSALATWDADDYGDWIRAGHALRALGDAGRELWTAWASRSAKFDPDETEARWHGFRPDHTGYAAIFAEAQRRGWRNPRASAAQAPPASDPDEVRSPEFSDEALALAFAAEHAERLRYVAMWGAWQHWNGRRWATDESMLAFDLARTICREAAARCDNKPSIAKGVASAKTVAAVVTLARADRRLAADVDQWDRDLYALNTPDGVVDLRTGYTRPHDPRDYLTKITAVGPGGDCPRWLAFLAQITGGDRELQDFLQRAAGYGLCGDPREDIILFGHGSGLNGKSVFVDTLGWVLGDYHTAAPSEVFTASNTDKHPTELARLRAARLVTSSEIEPGKRWAESRIKSLTGGDVIVARFLHRDFFEYRPQFTLLIIGNSKPSLRSVDVAIRRRLLLIPFSQTIPASERDNGLRAKLRAEAGGILRWMIEGCLLWQHHGLAPPPCVREATDAYLDAEDTVGRWIDARCEVSPSAFTTSKALWSSYKLWAEDEGEYVGSAKRLGEALNARGLVPAKERGDRGFRGLKLTGARPS